MAGAPVFQLKPEKLKGVSISIFRNPNGFMVSLQKRYRTKDGQWQNTNNYFPRELSELQLALEDIRAWFEANAPEATAPPVEAGGPAPNISTDEPKTPAKDPEDPGPGFNGALY